MNPKDCHHKSALAALDRLNEPLITTWPVLAETCHLLLARIDARAEIRFIDSLVAGAFHVFDLDATHRSRIAELMRDYVDLPMDLADASLIILAEHLKHGRILSTDVRDFGVYRWKNRRPFVNLLG